MAVGKLQGTGGDGYTQLQANIPIDKNIETVASTGPLAASTYYATATGFLNVAAGDLGGFCQHVMFRTTERLP